MCGRYANHLDALRDWAEVLGDWPAQAPTSYNVAPTTDNPVATGEGWSIMRWGLVPHWSKEAKTKYSTINARAEKVTESPAYRSAWKRGQRCLVPALGYYEWRKTSDGKQPYFIHRDDGQPLMFAGLWDCWRGGDAAHYSYSIITAPALSDIEYIHPRMPLALPLEAGREWLAGPADAAARRLAPQPLDALTAYPIPKTVNNPCNDGPELIQPLESLAT